MEDGWKAGMSGGFNCDEPAPRQRICPMAGNLCHPAMSPHTTPSRPGIHHTMFTMENKRMGRERQKWKQRTHPIKKCHPSACWNVLWGYNGKCSKDVLNSAATDHHEHTVKSLLMDTSLWDRQLPKMDTSCWSPPFFSHFTVTILSIRQTLPQNGQRTLEKCFISEKYLKTEMLVRYMSVIFCSLTFVFQFAECILLRF